MKRARRDLDGLMLIVHGVHPHMADSYGDRFTTATQRPQRR